MVDVQERALGTLEEDSLVGVDRVKQEVSRVGDVRLETVGVTAILLMADHVPMHGGGADAYATYEELVAGLADRLETTVLVPPSNLVTTADFADPIHMNRTGTVSFTTWLAAELASL